MSVFIFFLLAELIGIAVESGAVLKAFRLVMAFKTFCIVKKVQKSRY